MEPLSSIAITVSTLIATKAFEKTGEKLGDVLNEHLGKFINLIKAKALPKTQAVQAQSAAASYAASVEELATATQSDPELAQAIQAIAQTVEADPSLLEKVQKTVALVKAEPSIINNQTQLAEKIGLVVQGGTVEIQNFSF